MTPSYERWYKKHPTANAERNRRDRAKLREEVFAMFGSKCRHCGYCKDQRALQVDHINGRTLPQNAWRRGGVGLYTAIRNGSEDISQFQLLCANCNVIKKHERKEYSPLAGQYKYLVSE